MEQGKTLEDTVKDLAKALEGLRQTCGDVRQTEAPAETEASVEAEPSEPQGMAKGWRPAPPECAPTAPGPPKTRAEIISGRADAIGPGMESMGGSAKGIESESGRLHNEAGMGGTPESPPLSRAEPAAITTVEIKFSSEAWGDFLDRLLGFAETMAPLSPDDTVRLKIGGTGIVITPG